MTALGSNAHIFAKPHRREGLRWCFETPLPEVKHAGHPYYFMVPGGQVFTIAPLY